MATDAPDSLRLFAFGVGYDVDTLLLDSLAKEHHGQSVYVQPGMNLDEMVSTFYSSISVPVLTNLDLNFDGLSTSDLYPYPLPDLFAGSQVILLGRYKNGGTADITLSGEVDGNIQTFSYPGMEFDKESSRDSLQASIPRLWATRKVGYLLNEIRLKGANQEIIDQIVHLSIRYGIVTPYTSYLVTEQAPLGAAEQERMANDTYNQMLAMPTAAPAGQAAVQSAVDAGAMQEAAKAPELTGEASTSVQVVGSRTFVFSDGKWVDTSYDPDTMQPAQIEFLSAEYFDLVASNPELADAFALGEQVIARSNGKAYQVIPSSNTSQQHTTVPTVTPTPLTSQQPTHTPASPSLPSATPTQQPPRQPSGICGAGFLPLVLLPLIVLRLRRREK
jgi:Ca-activated chloride channel family protein